MELIMLVTYRMLTGEGKEECEDSALIYDRGSRELLHGGNGSTRIEEPCIIAIADGVGGNPGGRDASTFAMNALLEQFSDLEVPFDAGQIRDKIRQINCDLVSYSSETVIWCHTLQICMKKPIWPQPLPRCSAVAAELS